MSLITKFRVENETVCKAFAEFLGTFVLLALGIGVNAQYTLGGSKYGDWLGLCIGWGLAVAVGVWISGGVSGGHLNPAVSLAMTILGKLSWKLFCVYSLMQYLGALLASACVYGLYHDALFNYTNGTKSVEGNLATAGIWSTYPASFMNGASAFGDLTFSSFILVVGILAITDENNMAPPKGLIPMCVGFLIVVIGLAFGMNCGFALNPARDFGPRLFTWIAGYGTDVFTYPDSYNYFWIPIASTHLGAIIGSWTYLLLIGNHIAKKSVMKEIELKYTSSASDIKERNFS